ILKPREKGANAEADALLDARAKARAEKNWAESDRIRDALKAMGYVVEDTSQGQKVRRGG
ncbi:MAG: cysteine--tRNA ligase, partial [Firmicutes bacterium]|nr:cysteine--tRNA ligase [Bacillota bacterium]